MPYSSHRDQTCPDCGGAGQITGTPVANGLALCAVCPTCDGTGSK
jgi:DnaJ-class molecular chaperone